MVLGAMPLLWNPEPKPREPRPRRFDWLDWLLVATIVFVLAMMAACTDTDYECRVRFVWCLSPTAPCDTTYVVRDTVDTLPECFENDPV